MATHSPPPSVAILAGGLATRMRPLTTKLPKSLLTVAGEPFIAHQLRLLAREGASDVVLCCGYLGEQVEAFVGDGSKFGCRVRYSHEGDRLLGTGGALRKASALLGECFFVMYGDSYLDTRFAPIYEAYVRASQPALMTVLRNEGRWDSSNVEFADGVIRRYDKVARTPRMQHIDYGLGVLRASIVCDWSGGETFDLADLYRALAAEGRLAGYEVHERFYEIGSIDGLKETDAYLRGPKGPQS